MKATAALREIQKIQLEDFAEAEGRRPRCWCKKWVSGTARSAKVIAHAFADYALTWSSPRFRRALPKPRGRRGQ